MENAIMDLILDEIRENRREIKELRKEVWTLKTKFAVIALTMGIAGGKAGHFLSNVF